MPICKCRSFACDGFISVHQFTLVFYPFLFLKKTYFGGSMYSIPRRREWMGNPYLRTLQIRKAKKSTNQLNMQTANVQPTYPAITQCCRLRAPLFTNIARMLVTSRIILVWDHIIPKVHWFNHSFCCLQLLALYYLFTAFR